MTNTGAGPMTAAMTLTSVPTRLTPACLLEQSCDRKAFFVRIPEDGDQRSEVMAITIPK
jgi:hypothetical protein